MSRLRPVERVLILGGAGMVGEQVAREIAQKLSPKEIIISALTAAEVAEAIQNLERESGESGWDVRFVAAPADIFVPHALQGVPRASLHKSREHFDILFDDIFSPDPDAYRNSALVRMIEQRRPDVIVDCINTATAISYQDVYTTSRRVKVLLEDLEDQGGLPPAELTTFIESVRELLIAQGVPQITRHILFLHRALRDTKVRVYVKVGTTGTGGMGINIPYTHSEEKPSATLLSKSAIGFAHTGLLFLLARTPSPDDDAVGHGTMIKEVKPGAMIGFKRLGPTHVKLNGPSGRREPGYLLEPRDEPIGGSVDPRHSFEAYPRLSGREQPVKMVGVDTGENGFFAIGEFQAITYPRQMEYVTPEEVARTVVLEILGASTGRDVLAAIDGAITEPSYRAGFLREYALRELNRLEAALASSDDALPSVAVGHLGPPRLSKLLIEAFLLRAATESTDFNLLTGIDPESMRLKIEDYLESHPKVVSLITTIGIPILRAESGAHKLTRGPRLNIPVPSPDGRPIPVDEKSIERYAFLGWVDLRASNFEIWQDRLRKMASLRPDIVQHGSAAFDRSKYMPEEFIPGDAVGWLLANEADESGMVGHRMF